MNSKKKGTYFEQLATQHLTKKGIRIHAKNYRQGHKEIDIIAQEKDTLLFIEVKSRSSLQYGTPESFVTEAQASHYHEVATRYLEEINWSYPIRFDIIAIYYHPKTKQCDITHFKDAF